jgi:hypothetical protein
MCQARLITLYTVDITGHKSHKSLPLLVLLLCHICNMVVLGGFWRYYLTIG